MKEKKRLYGLSATVIPSNPEWKEIIKEYINSYISDIVFDCISLVECTATSDYGKESIRIMAIAANEKDVRHIREKFKEGLGIDIELEMISLPALPSEK